MRRNTAHKILKALILKKEVQEESKGAWVHGKRKFFTLTDKGIRRVVKATFDNLKNGVLDVRSLDTSPVTIQSLDKAIANADDPGFRQVLEAIRDYGKDRVGVHIPPEDKTTEAYKRREERKKKGPPGCRPDGKA
jgi:hypothetical protein